MSSPVECPICRRYDHVFVSNVTGGKEAEHYKCIRCGNFLISVELKKLLLNGKYKEETFILSGYIANGTRTVNRLDDDLILVISDNNLEIEINTANVQTIIENTHVPSNPLEMMNSWLLWMAKICNCANHSYWIHSDWNYPLVYAHDQNEFEQIINWLEKEGLIESKTTENYNHRLTLNGWQRVEKLQKDVINSNQAFVATWFDDKMDPIFNDGIKPALNEMGYDVIWMKILQHNGKIDDRIFAEIRRSGVLIADFTGNRGGVYYEAGFAQGLGIPVIWMCKDVRKEIKNLHFDTRQYNHIMWKDAVDLKQKLIDRIGATIPGRTLKQKI